MRTPSLIDKRPSAQMTHLDVEVIGDSIELFSMSGNRSAFLSLDLPTVAAFFPDDSLDYDLLAEYFTLICIMTSVEQRDFYQSRILTLLDEALH